MFHVNEALSKIDSKVVLYCSILARRGKKNCLTSEQISYIFKRQRLQKRQRHASDYVR